VQAVRAIGRDDFQADFVAYFHVNYRRIELEVLRGHGDDSRRRLDGPLRLWFVGLVFLRRLSGTVDGAGDRKPNYHSDCYECDETKVDFQNGDSFQARDARWREPF
jgi:hypothetical protein